ncbi:MAG TPA: hypothetical protein VKZ42_04815 [Flavobacteriaceae bacterium]|nr:hypothetical protein [Flavobacteriaceae bacterium]
MENPFKKIIRNEKLPSLIRERVLADVASIKLVLDIADLTMIKYPSSLEEIYKITKKNNKK